MRPRAILAIMASWASIAAIVASCGNVPRDLEKPLSPVPPTLIGAATAVPEPKTILPIPTLAKVTPTLNPEPARLAIADTEGVGVFIRQSPGRTGDRIAAWPDGTIMIAAGEERQDDGRVWRNVRDPAGNIGWVANDYLIPAATRTPVPELQTTTPVARRSVQYALELVSAEGRWERESFTVRGAVRSLIGDLPDVVAVVDWYNADDRLVKSDTARLDPNPLPGGAIGHFLITTSDNPALQRFRIAFRGPNGLIAARDASAPR